MAQEELFCRHALDMQTEGLLEDHTCQLQLAIPGMTHLQPVPLHVDAHGVPDTPFLPEPPQTWVRLAFGLPGGGLILRDQRLEQVLHGREALVEQREWQLREMLTTGQMVAQRVLQAQEEHFALVRRGPLRSDVVGEAIVRRGRSATARWEAQLDVIAAHHDLVRYRVIRLWAGFLRQRSLLREARRALLYCRLDLGLPYDGMDRAHGWPELP